MIMDMITSTCSKPVMTAQTCFACMLSITRYAVCLHVGYKVMQSTLSWQIMIFQAPSREFAMLQLGPAAAVFQSHECQQLVLDQCEPMTLIV